jgi:hypothetical protein
MALARLLRQETTMSLKWVAQRLHVGSWTYVSNLLNAKPSTPESQHCCNSEDGHKDGRDGVRRHVYSSWVVKQTYILNGGTNYYSVTPNPALGAQFYRAQVR